ncbi:MAG: pyruvate kinase [Candidatus Micrarchaeia archaeon]
MAKTKIICTIGPEEDDKKIRLLLENGMDVARLNGSYFFGEEENFKKRIKLIRSISDSISILLDLPGPKVRTKMKENICLKKGDHIGFFYDRCDALTELKKIEVTGPLLHVGVNDIILADDGNLEFKVIELNKNLIIAQILNEGTLIHGKGLNFPTKELISEYLRERDKILIKFARENELDFVGASFVRDKTDVIKLREFLAGSNVKIISKIETKAALKNLEEIIEVSDAIMIDRGDLSAETKMEHLPIIQKEIIKTANKIGKPVITATELLHNMIKNSKPTKAEISDIANAVLDGTSAVMLSGETAIGINPIESLKTMKRIIENTEELLDYKLFDYNLNDQELSNAISKSVYNLSNQLKINKIVCFAGDGYTPKMISRFKPSIPIIAVTNSKNVQRSLNLVWGVTPIYILDFDNNLTKSIKSLLELKKLSKDDLIIVTQAEEIIGELKLNSIIIKEVSKFSLK